MKTTILLLAVPFVIGAQTTVNGGRTFMGRLDASGATGTIPYRTGTGSPAARDDCSQPGEAYFQTDAQAGQNLWMCTAAGTPGTWASAAVSVGISLDGTGQGNYTTLNLVTASGLTWSLTPNGSTLNMTPAPDTMYLLSQTAAQNGAPFLCPAAAAGNGAAYTCNTTPARASYANAMLLEFRPDVNCAGGVTTLNVNGLGPMKIFKVDGATNLAADDCRAGSHYWLMYNAALDGGSGGFEFKSLLGNAASGGGGGGLPDPGASGLVARTTSGTAVARTFIGGTGITCTNGDGVTGNPVCTLDTTVGVTQSQFQNLAPLVFNGTLSGSNYDGGVNPTPGGFVDVNNAPLVLHFCPNVNWTGGSMTVNPGIGVKRVYVYGSDPPADTFRGGSCYLLTYNASFTVDGVPNTGAFEVKTLPSTASPYLLIPNDGTTGTTLNKLTRLTGAPSAAVSTGPGDAGGVAGITVAGAGTTLTATLRRSGSVPCVFDGATTAGDYVQISSSIAGDCHDFGAAYPSSGQVIGRVLSTNASTGTYNVDLFEGEIRAGGGYSTIDGNGTPLTQQSTANFSSEFAVADNPGASRTDISINSIAGAKVSGNISGNAGTATALAASGTTCASGQPALGIDAGGNALGCAALTAAQVTNAFDKSTGNSLGANAETLTDITTPANPSAGTTKYYSKAGKLCSLDSSGNENCTGVPGVTSVATTSPLSGGTITATGAIACPTCVTGSSLTSGQLLKGSGSQGIQTADLTGDVTTAGGLATTISANAVTSAKMAVGNTRRLCTFENDTQSATVLANAQITGHSCQVPNDATVVEVVVTASGGTPSVLVERYRPSSAAVADLLSGALATGASGAYACANGTVSTTCGITNITSSSSITIANTALTKGDAIRIKSATAGGVATWHNVTVWYTLN